MAKTEQPKKRSVSVLERRLNDPFAFQMPSIPSKPAGQWVFRAMNSEVYPNRTYVATHGQGWDYATPEDIQGPIEDYGWELRDGRIVRGLKGNEWLGKMPKADYDAVQKAKAGTTLKQTLGKKETRDAVVAQASANLGDEGASYLHRSLHRMEVEDSVERVPIDDAE